MNSPTYLISSSCSVRMRSSGLERSPNCKQNRQSTVMHMHSIVALFDRNVCGKTDMIIICQEILPFSWICVFYFRVNIVCAFILNCVRNSPILIEFYYYLSANREVLELYTYMNICAEVQVCGRLVLMTDFCYWIRISK